MERCWKTNRVNVPKIRTEVAKSFQVRKTKPTNGIIGGEIPLFFIAILFRNMFIFGVKILLNSGKVVGEYCGAVRKLTLEILEVIGEGLGLERSYFEGEMIENPAFSGSHYPPCPHPSMTMGLIPHCDPTLITLLFQDLNGLQFLNNGEWVDVDDVFIVNVGYILEVISNDLMKAREHRVVANAKASRQSLTYLIFPKDGVTIQPAKSQIHEANSQHYRSMMKVKEFRTKYTHVMYSDNNEEIMKFISFNQP